MKILLDNCVDWRAARLLAGHDVIHARDVGWEQLSNGNLLAAAASGGYDVIITVDKKIKYEQNLELLPLTVIEIDTPDSRLPAIVAIAQGLKEALARVAQYRFISVDRNSRVTSRAERV
jgi:predicted nuclease of predicted toxin-antitoxin system